MYKFLYAHIEAVVLPTRSFVLPHPGFHCKFGVVKVPKSISKHGFLL